MTDQPTLDAYQGYAVLLSRVWEGKISNLLIKPVGPAEAGVLLGADKLGRRHLLVPIGQDFAVSDQHWQHLQLTDWNDPRDNNRFLDLICASDSLGRVFAQLANDVVSRITHGEVDPQQALLQALDEWKTLLKSVRAMTEDAARGLFGELLVLRGLAKANPHFALEVWTGPDAAAHDFTSSNGSVEVKSSAKEGRDVTISSLRQLDPIPGKSLTLIRLQLMNSVNGSNLAALIQEIAELGVPHESFTTKLSSVGYIPGTEVDQWKFEVVGPWLGWHVGEDFPGLRHSDIPPSRLAAITRVSYTLDLVAAENLMDEAEIQASLQRLVTRVTP